MLTAGLNVKNRTVFCRDNLDVLRGLNSDCIDLVYLDPPFNKKKTFTAPLGSQAEGASFKDIFRKADVKDEWLFLIEHKHKDIFDLISAVKTIFKSDYNWCYLAYMAIRLIECHRVLKPTGSLYLHGDPTMSHYLKLLLDCIFGETNFRNEIVWGYKYGSRSKKHFGRKHDIILFYVKTSRGVFNEQAVRIEHESESLALNYRKVDAKGRRYREGKWKSGKVYRYYADEGRACDDIWADINALHQADQERTGYPTQKPLALLRRIILASSDKNQVVLDPFCGCATTLVAAEVLGRQWLGIDVSPKAYQLVSDRLRGNGRQLAADSQVWRFTGDIIKRTDIPARSDVPAKPRQSPAQMKRLLFVEQNGKCALCKTSFEERHFEIDHFYPKSQGGIDDISNRQLLCGSCNRIKGDRSMEEAIAAARQ